MNNHRLRSVFSTTPILSQLCTQNGWLDPETIEIETLRHEEDQVLCSVTFNEILMEGSVCIAGRVSCWGRFRVQLDANVVSA